MSSSNQFSITINPASGPPSWFTQATEKRWTVIPGVNTLDDVKANWSGSGYFNRMATAWTGAFVNQDTREYMFAASGGHTDYYGNEAYALNLGDEAPQWNRLNEPSAITGGTEGHNLKGDWGDGKPRATHTYNRCCSAFNRLWLAGMDSMSGLTGYESSSIWSLDRSSLEWTHHGYGFPNGYHSGTKFLGGSAAYDPVDKKIWSVVQYAEQGVSLFSVDVDPASGTFGQSTAYDKGYLPWSKSWSVVVPESRLLVIGYGDSGGLATLDLNNPTAAFVSRPRNGTPNAYNEGVGAFYHQPSEAILFWGDGFGSTVGKLKIPTILSDIWLSTPIAAAPGSLTPPNSLERGTFNKFNVVNDMGNGQSCIVLCNGHTYDTYFYKLPTGEIS